MFDIKKAKSDAEKEVAEEKAAKAKEAIKQKLRAIDQSEKILVNLRRELDDLLESLQ
jgi:hypothetical protein